MKKALSRKNLWDHCPRLVKSTVGSMLGLLPPAILLGKRYRENYSFLRQAQWWSEDRVKEYQFDKLKVIIELAYNKTKFYHTLCDEVGFQPGDFNSLENINRLPTIDKQIVIENFSDICTEGTKDWDVDFGSTGGTGGGPLYLYLHAKRSAVEYAYLTTSWNRVGFKVGMPMGVIRGKSMRADRNGLWHDYDPILRHHYYSSFHISDENMKRYLEHMTGIGACFLHVYPSSVAALARFCRRAGVRPPDNIRGIIAESEIVYPEQQQMVEEVFGCRYFSCYGHTEKLVLAAECEYSHDYHVWPTYGYFELLDDKGNPVSTPGQRGEIVGTGFINTVMPLIRYRTGDWATYVGDHCEGCGREHTIIRDIRGHRTQEVLIAADGSEISWTALNMHDDTFLNVRQFQFTQETPGKAVLRIVPRDGFNGNDTKRIKRNLCRKLDGQLTFTVEQVDSISLSPRGKAIYVDQRIALDQKSLLEPGTSDQSV